MSLLAVPPVHLSDVPVSPVRSLSDVLVYPLSDDVPVYPPSDVPLPPVHSLSDVPVHPHVMSLYPLYFPEEVPGTAFNLQLLIQSLFVRSEVY